MSENVFGRNVSYFTFPNINLCLSIYKENSINYMKTPESNQCLIDKGMKGFVSRLYGFHNKPFEVEIYAPMDQICILFNPSSLRAFTKNPYNSLLSSDSVFQEIFGVKSNHIIDSIFAINDLALRAEILERVLLNNLKNEVSPKLQEAIFLISDLKVNSMSIATLKNRLKVSEVTLFRLFTNHLGQNPKSYLRTIRFRNALTDIIHSKRSLSNIAYAHDFFDQAHFIKDFKNFSGNAPKELIKRLSLHQDNLAWIYNKR
ncbi:MAG: AraC family transcriptional regulator [Sphingobacteriales bacterium]|nr:MAG: AraC family transcriptional regulator [Sphingobacteriales bacterium]